MLSRGPNTSSDGRQLVVYRSSNGKSCREVSRLLQIPKSTVFNILKRFREEDRIDLKKQAGQPPKLSVYDKRVVSMCEVRQQPKISAPKLTMKLEEATGEAVTPSNDSQFN